MAKTRSWCAYHRQENLLNTKGVRGKSHKLRLPQLCSQNYRIGNHFNRLNDARIGFHTTTNSKDTARVGNSQELRNEIAERRCARALPFQVTTLRRRIRAVQMCHSFL